MRFDLLAKLAASRLDKEVLRGNVAYSDVDPTISPRRGTNEAAKLKSRANAMAMAPVSPEQLKRTRALNEKLYRARMGTHELPPTVEEQAVASGRMSRMRSEPMYRHLSPSGFYKAKRRVVKHPAGLQVSNDTSVLDVGGGHAKRLGHKSYEIMAPDDFGQVVRTALRQSSDTSRPRRGGPVKLLRRHPIDSTINYAVLRHELGELGHLREYRTQPVNTHGGVKAFLEQDMALRGDPGARRLYDMSHDAPEDALVNRLIRQVGGTPNSPLPIGGRHQRALERALTRHVSELSPGSRAKGLALALAGRDAPYVPNEVLQHAQRLRLRGVAPEELIRQINNPATLRNVTMGIRKGKARAIARKRAREIVKKFLMHGKI